MALILNIETATKNCSVSLSEDGHVIALKEINNDSYSHAENLHPFILDVVKKAAVKIQDIDAIAVGKGPGSYTGLRIGVSAAKGLCFALDVPLISILTLQTLAQTVAIKEGVVVPLLDARRMEVYSAIFSSEKELLRETQAQIIDTFSFQAALAKGLVYFVGDGAQKCKEVITHANAVFIDGAFPSAKEMAQLSYNKLKNNDFEDVAYFEPFYLKDFRITPPKKKA